MRDAHDDVIRAAGAVVWRPGAAGPELALVHRPRYDDWSYPKGKCHREEHVLTAAIREVAEETGLQVVLGRPLSPSEYQFGDRAKQVRYWVARCTDSVDFIPNSEVDEMSWVPLAVARNQLSYARDVALLDEFSSAPALTVPLILLRHATAGRKKDKHGPADLARPLDERGQAEAKLLAGLLASYGKCRVVSSSAERCVATVRPYAAAIGAVIEIEPALVPKAAAAAERAASLATSAVPTVICAHRENLPALVTAARLALGGAAQDSKPLRKGAFWVLQSAGGVLVSAERQELAG